MRVVDVARDQMPVQMRRHVAEARDIHLLRGEDRALHFLDRENNAHERRAFFGREVGELPGVRVPDHADKARIVGLVDRDDAYAAIVVDQTPARS